MRKLLLSASAALVIVVFASAWGVAQLMETPSSEYADYEGSTFNEVWGSLTNEVRSDDPAERNIVYGAGMEKPKHALTKSLLKGDANYNIFKAARDTLNSSYDLWTEKRVKLLRPNGICLAGSWHITEETGYTGLLAKDATALVIARASVTSDEIERKEWRSFGLAVKVFPTIYPDEQVKTANVFTIETNVGKRDHDFRDAKLTNLPDSNKAKIFWRSLVEHKHKFLSFLGLMSTIKKAQEKVDPEHYETRQLYPLTHAGVADEDARTPAYIQFSIEDEPNFPVISDFREELRAANFGNKYRINIRLGTTQKDGAPVIDPKVVGFIEVLDDVVSDNCDQKLHFAHPKWRDDVR